MSARKAVADRRRQTPSPAAGVSLRGLDPDEQDQLEPKTSKGRQSRRAIQDGARKVLREDGYANARVSDMAAEAGFSLGAFYRYFRDKRDVLMSLLDELFRDMYSFARAPWEPGHPEQSVKATTGLYLQMYRDNADLYRVMIEAAQREPTIEAVWADARHSFYERIARMLRRGQEQGVVRGDVDADLAAALLGGMTEHYAFLTFVLGRGLERTDEQIAQQVASLWASGCFVPPTDIGDDS